MTVLIRAAVVAYLLALTLGLLTGSWILEGPRLFGVRDHGSHAGDVAVLAATATVIGAVLRRRA